MGDIADMIIEGELCQSCGVYLGSATGFPRSCSSCRRESASVRLPARKVSCPICKKRVKEVGLADHLRDSHNH